MGVERALGSPLRGKRDTAAQYRAVAHAERLASGSPYIAHRLLRVGAEGESDGAGRDV